MWNVQTYQITLKLDKQHDVYLSHCVSNLREEQYANKQMLLIYKSLVL